MTDIPQATWNFCNAIAIAGQITGKAGGRKWLLTLLENLGDDW